MGLLGAPDGSSPGKQRDHKKAKMPPSLGRVTSPPSLRGPICAPWLLRGSSGLVMLFLPGPPRPASGGPMHWLDPVLSSTSQSPVSTPLPTWFASGKDLPSEPRWTLPTPGGPRRLPTSMPGQSLLSAFPSTLPRQRFGGQVRSLEPAFPVCKCGASSPAREQCRGWAPQCLVQSTHSIIFAVNQQRAGPSLQGIRSLANNSKGILSHCDILWFSLQV